MTRRKLAIHSLAAIFAIAPLSAHQEKQSATASISGTLTSADGRPIRKAEVKLTSIDPVVVHTVVSDAIGRFEFSGVPAGEYSLTASKAGYLAMVLGARKPGVGMPGNRLKIGAGERIENVALTLHRGSAISGVVTDEYGDPAMSVMVRVLRFGYMNGHRMAQPVGQATTDDIGSYRVGGLIPGEYVITAVPRDTVALATARFEELRGRGAPGLPAPNPVGYVPAYFGGTASPSGAGRIQLGLTEHAGGIDIQLVAVSTGTVSGVVTDPAGVPTSASVQLIDPTLPIANMTVWFRNPGPDGRFSFAGVVPGTYVLRAQGNRPFGEVRGSAFTAATEVRVAEGTAIDGSLRLQRGVTVSGRLDLDTLPSIDPQKLRVEMEPITGPADWEAAAPRATPNAAGRFSLANVVPGSYRVRVNGLPKNWSLASANFGELDAADINLVVKSEPISAGVLTFTSQTGAVSGTLSNAVGEPSTDRVVLLFPAEREYWVAQSRRIQLAQPGRDGRYTFGNLPVGSYRLAAIEAPDSGQQFDLEFLAQHVGGSSEIRLAPGEARVHDLRVK